MTAADPVAADAGVPLFTVEKPGALSMLQDLGRVGYQRFGVLVGGAMDPWSHRLANALVGNDGSAATLEMVLTGPVLSVNRPILLAVCGADLSPTVTGRTGTEVLPQGRPVWVREGARIAFGARAAGLRAYLAVRDGFAAPPVMGSRSTYLRGAFGGLGGRALRAGDVLAVRQPPGDHADTADRAAAAAAVWSGPAPAPARFARSVSGSVVVPASPIIVAPVAGVADVAVQADAETATAGIRRIRLIPGPQWDQFGDAAQARLFAEPYRIGLQSDRMGYRLEGPVLERIRPIEMISEAVTFGTMQVPPDGQPIVLMADRQTTGGYPKIAMVATVDLPLLAQSGPGALLRFVRISLADAQRVLLAREREYSHVRQALARPDLARPGGIRRRVR